MEAIPDEQLIQQYRSESNASRRQSLLRQLLQLHQTRVAAFCYRMTGDVDRAADLAEAILREAFRGLESFGGESTFVTTLYTTARNRCIEEIRLPQSPSPLTDGPLPGEAGDVNVGTAPPASELPDADRPVKELIGEMLDDTEARVMTLHYLYGVPTDAVTRLLGLGNQTGAGAYLTSAGRKMARAFGRRRPWGQR
jgi:RNA polymerase sigma factor (sigma-70 family)